MLKSRTKQSRKASSSMYEAKRNLTQERKQYSHSYYIRKIKPTRNLTGKIILGTIFDIDLEPIKINGQLRIRGAVFIN